MPGNNLTLVGGDIKFEGGKTTASDGNIELGGLSTAGTVGISEDGSLNFSENVALADVIIADDADVDVIGTGSGNITINARNLEVRSEDRQFRSISRIIGGIKSLSDSPNTLQPGNITINARENITISDSRISTQIRSGKTGNLGEVVINTGSLTLINGGRIDAGTAGIGDSGSIQITANIN